MNASQPSSWVVSLYITSFSTVLFVLVHFINAEFYSLLAFHAFLFFCCAFILVLVSLEVFVYRNLRNWENSNRKEIEKLKKLENFRREFLGDVSHELKTPIFAIMGFIDTLLNGGALEDEKHNRKFLAKALKHADRLSSLVHDILVITQIESGEMSMDIGKFNLLHLITETVDSLDEKFTRKDRNVTVEIVSGPHEDTIVMGDRERIQQVLYNLIDNAVKYGDLDGKVTIELADLDDKVLVKVRDNGPGIEPEHLTRLFHRFYRVDKSRSREKGGTGLGLAICRHFIEAHGEKIWVESEVGEGSVFNFTLSKMQDGHSS